jgi:hypothetical protein
MGLAEAYRATSYIVEAPGAPIALRVDEPSAELDELLGRFDARSWAFITAYNPYSEKRSADENQRRHRHLVERVTERGLTSFPTQGVDDDGTWPTERGLFIVDMSRDDALALGRELEQNAILVGARGGAPELLFCFDDEQSSAS